jgi:quercetin dioxygenase-like cupin family protein
MDVVEVRPFGPALRDQVTTSLLKTEALQLMRLVLQAGQGLPEHHVQGAITVHCLEGESLVTTLGRSCRLLPGQLVMLEGGVPHAVTAVTDASLLVTVVLQPR